MAYALTLILYAKWQRAPFLSSVVSSFLTLAFVFTYELSDQGDLMFFYGNFVIFIFMAQTFNGSYIIQAVLTVVNVVFFAMKITPESAGSRSLETIVILAVSAILSMAFSYMWERSRLSQFLLNTRIHAQKEIVTKILHSIPEPICIVDKKEKVYANNVFELLFDDDWE